jgi:hypothetical protein
MHRQLVSTVRRGWRGAAMQSERREASLYRPPTGQTKISDPGISPRNSALRPPVLTFLIGNASRLETNVNSTKQTTAHPSNRNEISALPNYVYRLTAPDPRVHNPIFTLRTGLCQYRSTAVNQKSPSGFATSPAISNRNTTEFKNLRKRNKTKRIPISNRNNNSRVAISLPALPHSLPAPEFPISASTRDSRYTFSPALSFSRLSGGVSWPTSTIGLR